MRRRPALLLALAIALAAGGCYRFALAADAPRAATAPAANDDHAAEIAAATEASDRWLDLITRGKFAESWLSAAPVLQDAATQLGWVDELTKRDLKFGRLITRERQTAQYSKTMRGAPTGDYVTVTYLSKFERTPVVEETLAVARNSTGHWQVAGYDIALAPAKGK